MNEHRKDAGRTPPAEPRAHAAEHPIVGRFAAMTSEHNRLAVMVQRLANVCAELESGRMWVDPVPVIAELELGLWRHFATEEADDYFGAIARERPALLPKVAELKAEHVAIRRAISELSAIAGDKRRRRDVAPSAARVIAKLKTHEDEENQFLQEFVLRDEGASPD